MPETKGYNIRLAELTDTTDIVILGKEFYKQYYKDLLGWNTKKVTQNLETAIKEDYFLVLVMEHNKEIVGMFVAMVAPCFFSDDIQGSELAWYVTKDHRKTGKALEMLDWYENWAKEHGAKLVNMMNIEIGPKSILSVYKKKGYKLRENTFIKELM